MSILNILGNHTYTGLPRHGMPQDMPIATTGSCCSPRPMPCSALPIMPTPVRPIMPDIAEGSAAMSLTALRVLSSACCGTDSKREPIGCAPWLNMGPLVGPMPKGP